MKATQKVKELEELIVKYECFFICKDCKEIVLAIGLDEKDVECPNSYIDPDEENEDDVIKAHRMIAITKDSIHLIYKQ